MKYFAGLILVIFAIVFTGKQENNITGTVWISPVSEDTADTLRFTDSLYFNYSSEIRMKYFGEYSIKGDTLYLSEKGRYWNFKEYENPDKKLIYYYMTDSLEFLGIERYRDSVWVRKDLPNFMYYIIDGK